MTPTKKIMRNPYPIDAFEMIPIYLSLEENSTGAVETREGIVILRLRHKSIQTAGLLSPQEDFYSHYFCIYGCNLQS